MTLEESQILEFIQNPQNKHLKNYQSEHSKLDVYFNGGDIASQIQKITNFENAAQKKLRQKIARSPKDVIHKLLKQFNQTFSATGGSELIEISQEARKEEFAKLLSELPSGISLKKWMQDYWLEAYITDPNGVILIESENNDNPKSYPTYKSISVIKDYTTTWGKLDYLILKHGKYTIKEKKEIQVYRVIDDEKDALYYEEGKKLKEFESETEQHKIDHQKGFVPAILVSDIVDKKTEGRKPFIHKIDELLDEYVRENSVLSIFKFLHAYPRYWQYATSCKKCNGSGKVKNSETGELSTCNSCNGTGMKLILDVSDGITLPLPKNNTQPVVAPNIAGFVAPPIDAWGKMEESLDNLEKKMEFAMLGTYSESEKSETATGRFIDSQPVVTELNKFSTTEETIKQKVADYMAKWMYGNDYGTISIKNGRRFVAEHPDKIFEKYTKAKENQAPVSTLDYLYKQYLLSEYQNDTLMYQQKLKEFQVEPLVHYTVQELDALDTDMSIKVQEKIYYSEWIVKDIDWNKETDQLKKEFQEFINTKSINNESTTES